MNELPENLITLTPLVAAMQERDEDEQFLLSSEFLTLTETSQEILVGEATLQLIRSWVTQGLIPETHMVAIAKLIGLAALDPDVPITSLAPLIERIGISSVVAQQVSQEITQLIGPILDERREIESDEKISLVELPPMSRPTERGPRVVTGPKVPARNIIDLRKQP